MICQKALTFTGAALFIHAEQTGGIMSNTIELLEAIGRDASLRHAPRESLAKALGSMDASSSLTMAAASGDRSHLAGELGDKINLAVQVNHNPGQGGCDPCEDDREDAPRREDDGADDHDGLERQL